MAHRLVVIGGGFGGLNLVRGLRRAGLEITLLDRRNFHLFQPLLYQVATGELSPANIATPLRSIFRRRPDVRVLLAEMVDFDVHGRQVILADGGRMGYDTLAIATGATHSYFGHEQWAEFAPGLKTIENATAIRRRIFQAFEEAERRTDPDEIRRLLTFVIVGAGPTGVELAGTLAEIAHHTLRRDFRAIDPTQARIILVEGAPRVLPPYPQELSAKARRQLEQLGVTVRTGGLVTEITTEGVLLEVDGREERISARTVLWGAGVRASSLGRKLAGHLEIETDRAGRMPVEPDLTIPGHPEIFVLGDLAHCPGGDGRPLPGVAPVAIQQGKYLAQALRQRLTGGTPGPFVYHDRGTMAAIGRNRAVATIGKLRFSGYFAWLLWLFVHLMYLVAFESRILVLIQWAWNYMTWNRNARLITEVPLKPDPETGVTPLLVGDSRLAPSGPSRIKPK